MHILSIENMSKSYGEKILFESLSIHMNQGDKVGLIAPNGSGKSTLLRMTAGLEVSDDPSSKLFIHPSIRMGFLKQAEDMNRDQTVANFVFSTDIPEVKALKVYKEALGAGNQDLLEEATLMMDNARAWSTESRINEILSKLNIHESDKKLNELSGGQLKRVSLAKLLIDDPDLLILDEPTNHLDVEMIQWLEEYLTISSKSILMVTHDRYFLEDVCNQILELANGSLYTYPGNYSVYLQKKQDRIEQEKSDKAKASKLMKKELEWINRMPKARTTKNKARIDAFDEIRTEAKKSIYNHELEFNVLSRRMGSTILECDNISKAYGEKSIIKNFSYKWKKGEKIGLVGRNGTGKSTLLNILTGKIVPDSGEVKKGSTIEFGYFNQEGLHLENDQPIIEVIKSVAESLPTRNGGFISAEQLMEKFMFPRSQQRVFYSLLSGGERRRLHLLKILMGNPNFLILDEPTNDLDVLTLNTLEEFLIEFEGCIIIASHDRYLTDKIVDHLFIMDGYGGIKDFNGSYSDYLQWQKVRDEESKNDKVVEPKSQPSENQYEARKKVRKLEQQIEKLEKKKSELELKFQDPAISVEDLTKWNAELGKVKEQIVELESDWEELVEKLES